MGILGHNFLTWNVFKTEGFFSIILHEPSPKPIFSFSHAIAIFSLIVFEYCVPPVIEEIKKGKEKSKPSNLVEVSISLKFISGREL
jgi:hypothetical protein